MQVLTNCLVGWRGTHPERQGGNADGVLRFTGRLQGRKDTEGEIGIGPSCGICYRPGMTLKQQVHDLVDALADDSPLLLEVREALRMNRAIGAALEDVREGRTYSAEDFMSKVEQRWPRKASA